MKSPANEGEAAPLVVITGPTASGKAAAAHELARLTGSEIVSMDSMKVYREMDIATAKPSVERRAEVRYHLVDIVDPDVDFSVGEYLPRLEEALRDIRSRGKMAIVSGGTPLYLKTYLDGFSDGRAADWTLRQRLLDEVRLLGPEALHERLRTKDPQAADRIHCRDLRRIVRALEVVESTGQAISDAWDWDRAAGRRSVPRIVAFCWPREELYCRIDRRVEKMVDCGLLDEARMLGRRVPPLSRSASQAIGYKEAWRGGEGGRSREEIVADIQQSTRRFAKRQLTWFRKLPVQWIPAGRGFEPERAARDLLQ